MKEHIMTNGATSPVDERRGFPSSSGLERIALCPGSFLLEQISPEEPESDDATEGRMIHEALLGLRPNTDLDLEQQYVAERCRTLEMRVIEQFGMETGTEVREIRLWATGHPEGSPMRGSEHGVGQAISLTNYSGMPDHLRVKRPLALVIDYKTGRIPVPEARVNWQMRSLAVLAARNFPEVSEVVVALVQPRSHRQVTICRYEPADLRRADEAIWEILTVAEDPDAPRIPGESQCRYCKAKAICPEAREAALAVVPVSDVGVPPDILLNLEKLNGEQFAEVLTKLDYVMLIREAVRNAAKAYIQNGGTIKGHMLQQTTRREIPDALAAYNCVKSVMTAERFTALCKVGVGDLEKAYGQATGLNGSGLQEKFNEVMDGAVRRVTTEPQLRRDMRAVAGAH